MKFFHSFFIIFSLLCFDTAFAQSTSTAFSQMSFTDVSKSDVHYQAIEFLRSQNIIKGYIDGTLTQIITLIVRNL